MDTTLHSVLLHYDDLSTPFAESDVGAALGGVPSSEGSEANVARTAERIAFGVCEEYTERQPGWGTYYGPMFVVPGDDGAVLESPSIQLVTPEILEYWVRRAAEAKNPILKIRYGDIAWDLWSLRGTGPRPIGAAQIAVDETVRLLAGPPLQHPVDLIKKARRALSLAIQTNDAYRIAQVAGAMIDLEDRVGEDRNPGLWGFCLQELVLNPKVALAAGQEELIVDTMERRLTRVSTPGSETFDPFATEAIVDGLLPYYRRCAPEKIANLLALYVQSFRSAAASVDALTASHWLSKVAHILRQERLVNEADALEPEIRSFAEKGLTSLGAISIESEIPAQELEEYLQALLGSNLEEALVHIAVRFVPRKEEILDLQASLARDYPISFLMPKTIVDHRGMMVAEIPAFHDDPDSHFVQQVAQNLSFSGVFLHCALERFVSTYLDSKIQGLEEVLERQAALFTPQSLALLRAALRAYDDERWIECIHCLVPLLEALVRRNVEMIGGAIYRPRRPSKGFVPRQLDDLLRDGLLVGFWQRDDVLLYLRVLLTDFRGWNLRNRICHGEFESQGFTQRIANQLLHAVLVLGLVRRAEGSASPLGSTAIAPRA
jgi:hypothetical protein